LVRVASGTVLVLEHDDEVGLLAVVRKPFDVDEICAAVAGALDGEDCGASVTPGC